jgi:hypothetical protein
MQGVIVISLLFLMPYLILALLNERNQSSRRRSVVVLVCTVFISGFGLAMIAWGIQSRDPFTFVMVPLYQGIGCAATHTLTRIVR